MTYDIRPIVTDEDMRKVDIMWRAHSRLMRTPVTDPAELQGGQIVGAFDGEKLVGTLRHFDWPGLPYYSIGSLYIRLGALQRYDFSNPANPIPPILDFILAQKESEGFYTWFYTRAISGGYYKLQRDGTDLLSHTKLGCRYDRYVNEIVKAGQRAQHDYHDMMLARRTWGTNIMVVQCLLRNSERPWGDVIADEREYT